MMLNVIYEIQHAIFTNRDDKLCMDYRIREDGNQRVLNLSYVNKM